MVGISLYLPKMSGICLQEKILSKFALAINGRYICQKQKKVVTPYGWIELRFHSNGGTGFFRKKCV